MSLETLKNLLDAEVLLHQFGPWALIGIALIVFIESGVLFPFLPGDSLLVTAAALHAQLGLALWQVTLVACVAAIAGDQVGFWLGHKFGRRLFKDDARILRTDRLATAEAFFNRRSPLALVIGRFVPIVRTYVPLTRHHRAHLPGTGPEQSRDVAVGDPPPGRHQLHCAQHQLGEGLVHGSTLPLSPDATPVCRHCRCV